MASSSIHYRQSALTIIVWLTLGFSLQGQVKPVMQHVGLSNEWVSTIVQDAMGFIWIGTQDGLYRYDGYEYELLRNTPENTQSIAANWIREIAIDSLQNYWIGTYGGGITKFSPKEMAFVNFTGASSKSFAGNLIAKIAAVGHNKVVATSDVGYTLFNIETNETSNLGFGDFNDLLAVEDSILWLTKGKKSLLSYHVGSNHLEPQYTFDSKIHLLESLPGQGLLVGLENELVLFKNGVIVKGIETPKTFTHVTKGAKGSYLIGNTSSLYQFDLDDMRFYPIAISSEVSEKGMEAIFIDKQQNLWIGTRKGLYKQKKYHKAFYQEKLDVHARRITKHKNHLFIGGEEGLFEATENKTLEQLTDKSVMAMLSVSESLYLGSNSSAIYKLHNNNLREIALPPETGRLSVLGMVRDKSQRLWVGTWKGIAVYDAKDNLLKYITLNNSSDNNDAKTTKLHIDSKDRLWIITAANGVYRIDAISTTSLSNIHRNVKNYRSERANPKSLSSNILVTMEEDAAGNLWFGSDIGVVRYNEKTDDFERLYYQEALFDKKIMTLRADDRHRLWITTINDGIYVYHTKKHRFRHFTKNDGLLSNAFLYGSGFFDADDRKLYFGTDEGVQHIDLNNYSPETNAVKPIVTDFKVRSRSGKDLYEAAQIPFVQRIFLKAEENDFSVRFSSLDFEHPEKIQYWYRLNEDAWKKTDLQTAYFTNVPHGNHVLKVRAAYDGLSSEAALGQFTICIAPPWYLTVLAKTVYVLLFFLACFGCYRYFRWRWTIRLQLQLKETEATRLQNLHDFRSKLYTNIAHEFKTPLSLIAGPIQEQLVKGDLSDKELANLAMVQRNTHRMTALVDQLLQLSKLEEGKLKKVLQKANLGLFLHMLCAPFEYQASLKQMHFDIQIEPSGEVWYDGDIVEKIVTNLLSNAFKHSPRRGFCGFYVTHRQASVHMCVQNTIHEKAITDPDRLFERFYQKDEFSEGIGVGLSLVKELVAFYEGSIKVTLDDDNLLSFDIVLPIQPDASDIGLDSENSVTRSETANRLPEAVINDSSTSQEEERPILLIIEDHAEIRLFIKQCFETKYQVLEAGNGKDGLQIALEKVPDIILSDIRMPLMNGIQLCKRLRADERTSHIPIILLTANDSSEMEWNGLDSGADDFVSKPFQIQLLGKRIENLLALRAALRKRYRQEWVLRPKDIQVSSADELFFTKVQTILDDHLYDSSFTASVFSEKIAMSRMQLHRKLLAYTGLSTSAFIRSQRLKQSKRLLEDGSLTINEVAYSVGFATPTYFMKSFKKTFGKTPSEYQRSLKNFSSKPIVTEV